VGDRNSARASSRTQTCTTVKTAREDKSTEELASDAGDFPTTTSKMVGWRSTNPVLQLEKFGQYARGKKTITKSLGWPAEGVI